MQTFTTPTEWKSSAWWQNRPVEERIYHARLPKRYTEKLAGVTPEIRSWVDNFQPGNSLLLFGNSGAGKTAAAVTITVGLLEKYKLSARFTTSDAYIEMLKDQFGDNDNLLPEMYSTPYIVKYIQRVFDVVVLDGLGQERETEFASHELGSLLRYRYDDMRTMVITTTLSPVTLVRRYGERIKNAIDSMTCVRMA